MYYELPLGVSNLHFIFGAHSNPSWLCRRRVAFSISQPYEWEGTCENEDTRFRVRTLQWYLVLWWFTVFLKLGVYRPDRIDGVPR